MSKLNFQSNVGDKIVKLNEKWYFDDNRRKFRGALSISKT